MSLTRMSKRSSSIARRACSPLMATRNGYDSISRMDPINLQMDRSSSTTRIFGFTVIENSVRYGQRKYRAFTYLTFYHYLAPVPCRHFPRESQTQTETALFA